MRVRVLAATAIVATGLAGCGGDDARSPATDARPAETAPRERAEPPERGERLRPAPACPAGAANCAAASGRIVALESVDPDGDGDLHVILAGGGVTLPGVTVLDVSAALRPARDPRIGDWAAGAGPVYEGSYGQRQIEVDAVEFAPGGEPSPWRR